MKNTANKRRGVNAIQNSDHICQRFLLHNIGRYYQQPI